MDDKPTKSKADILLEMLDKMYEENGLPKSETVNKQGSFIIISPKLVRKYEKAKGINKKK